MSSTWVRLLVGAALWALISCRAGGPGTEAFDRTVSSLLSWVRQADLRQSPPGGDSLQILGGALGSAGAEDLSLALERQIEAAGRWTFPDRAVILLSPWLTPQALVRLFGDRDLVLEAARLARTGEKGPVAVELERRLTTELLSRLLGTRGSARVKSVAHWLTAATSYDDLVLAPEPVAEACRLFLEAAARTAVHEGDAALQRLQAARLQEPMNHYLHVDGLYFQSVGSTRLNGPGDPAVLLEKAEKALMETEWDRWWARSRSGPPSIRPEGGVEFDFWPLVIDGKGPTKVRIVLGSPQTDPESRGRLRRIPVQLVDNGTCQLAGTAHWLLELPEPGSGAGLGIHSVFDRVYPAANYRHDWAGVERLSWGQMNLDRVFGRMHVWVEDDAGPFPVVERVDQELRGLLAGVLNLPEGEGKSGLPGLAEWVARQ